MKSLSRFKKIKIYEYKTDERTSFNKVSKVFEKGYIKLKKVNVRSTSFEGMERIVDKKLLITDTTNTIGAGQSIYYKNNGIEIKYKIKFLKRRYMLKFQIGKLTLKNFLLHWIIAIFLVIISGYSFIMEELDLKKVCFFLIVSIFPGMLGSILLIASVKELLKAIKEKEYITLIAMILFIIIFAKYYFKL